MIVSTGFDLVSLLLHITLVCANPGYLVNKDIDFMQLLEVFESSSLCPECQTIRTSRSRHCIICQQCVDRYDHHCPWINNCVGIRNHNVFILYITAQFVSIGITFGLTAFLAVEAIRNFDKVLSQSIFDTFFE